jgi:hypothetical protein
MVLATFFVAVFLDLRNSHVFVQEHKAATAATALLNSSLNITVSNVQFVESEEWESVAQASSSFDLASPLLVAPAVAHSLPSLSSKMTTLTSKLSLVVPIKTASPICA